MMSAITELEKLVKACKDKYYNADEFLKVAAFKVKYPAAYLALVNANKSMWLKQTGVVTFDDAKYDCLEEVLKKLSPNSKALMIGAPVKKEKVELPFHMGSLNKIKPGAAAKWLASHKGPYIVMDKEDGLSIGIEYLGTTHAAYTRGDGSIGQNISYLIPHLKIPAKSKFKQLRGEIIMKKATFDKKWSSDFENARNMASGLVNRKDIHKAIKDIDVIIYEAVSPRGVPSVQLKALKAEGFHVVPHKVFETLTEQQLIDYYQERRSKSNHDIDGLVIMQDKKHAANTSGNPDFAVAFKMPTADNEVVAKILEVEWAASKHGYLKPRCRIEPVRLAGVTVTYATCHNAAFVRDNGIGPGAEVVLTRSGDVIPYIVKVVKKVKPSLPSVKEFGAWEWNETEVDIVLKDASSNDDVRVKQINHFFRTLEVENFSEGLVARFYEHGYDTVEKILSMTKADMLKVDGIQQRMASKIHDNIHNVIDNEVYLPSLMDASGIFGRNFGTKRFEPILDAYYPKILKWKVSAALVQQRIQKLEGFQATLAKQFASKFPDFLEWFDKIGIDCYYNEHDEAASSDKLAGSRIYITGFRDKELSAIIADNGGEEGGFTGKTTILIVKDKSVSNAKTDKAREMKIPVLTKEEFLKQFKL